MTAYNIVRFRVKAGEEEAFENEHRNMTPEFPGMLRFSLIKTGDRAYCIVGEWESMENIIYARPAMIGQLDRIRSMLEDLGDGLGVTDPVSGEAVFEYVAS